MRDKRAKISDNELHYYKNEKLVNHGLSISTRPLFKYFKKRAHSRVYQGQVESFDQFVILLKNNTSQMIYKHAISTIVPSQPVRMHRDAPKDEQSQKPAGAVDTAEHGE